METPNIIGFGSYGSVRGYGPLHADQDAAQRCAADDQHGCGAQGGYSDREVVAVADDGVCYSLDIVDWIPGPGGASIGAARYSTEDLAGLA